jgi:NAD(P)-dependent dehydrogenase (short-subunit alcohol dehydrogenase family)
MQDFSGKVAVITGGASGIGNAVATRLGKEGMKLVLADIDGPRLDAAVDKLRTSGADVTGVVADVSKLESIETLCEKAHSAYGNVHVLHNNAGVLGPLAVPAWETTERDWQWMMGVNFWSVVHGIRVFVPRMLAHGEEGHIVNTASSAGIAHSSTIYGVTKHAVVAVSEYLYFNLKQANANIGVTALCPGVLATNLPANSPRVRPEGLRNESAPSEIEQQRQVGFAENLARGKPPELAADMVFEAIRDQRFWVTTDSDWDERFSSRFDSILQRRNPESQTPVRQSAT